MFREGKEALEFFGMTCMCVSQRKKQYLWLERFCCAKFSSSLLSLFFVNFFFLKKRILLEKEKNKVQESRMGYPPQRNSSTKQNLPVPLRVQ